MTYDKNNIIVHEQNWPNVHCINLLDKDGLAMVRAYKKSNAKDYIISDLYVQKNARGKGIGHVLLQEIMDRCLGTSKSVSIALWIDENSDSWVRDWYAKKGFKHSEDGFIGDAERLDTVYTK